MAPRPQSLALLALLASAIISQSAALRSLRLADEAAGGTIAATSGDDAAFYDDRVELLLYIRSRCSDSFFCEAALDPVVRDLGSIVKVVTKYIIEGVEEGVPQCEHGPVECAGNTQQLCVAQYSPGPLNHRWFWPFVMCHHKNISTVGEPDVASACLKEAGVPHPLAALMQRCYSGSEGAKLLLQTSVLANDVPCCCTMYLDSEFRCRARKGFQECPGGSEELDFKLSICKAYEAKTGDWPKVCPDAGLARARDQGRA